MERLSNDALKGLINTNYEFKKAYDDHLELARKADEIEKQKFLNSKEELILNEIKKLKLKTKDVMEEIVDKHLATSVA